MAVAKAERPITGWHVLIIFVAFFGVVIAVNFTLAWNAVHSFPGLEVDNGYIASQSFDAEMAAQKGLHWQLKPHYDPTTNELRLTFSDAKGAPVTLGSLAVLVGRPTETTDDVTPVFALKDGVYVAPVALHLGKWMMAVDARAQDGTIFRQRITLYVSR
jgi:nitrogen fixation protein FixH